MIRSAATAIASALTACTLLVDTSGLSGGPGTDAGSPANDSSVVVGAPDAAPPSTDAGADASPPTATTPLFDPASTWPVSTASTSNPPTTPTFATSAACTDVIVLANSGIGGGDTASATISSDTGMSFTEATKDIGNNADTIYIWRATSSCASRSGTVTVNWDLPPGADLAWSNVVVFAFTHSRGIGMTAHAHNGTTSINTISITPGASNSWLFASLSGNGDNNANTPGAAGDFVQQWSSEAAIQSYGNTHTPTPTTAGVPVTFSLTTADDIWASAAAEVLSE